LGKGEGCVGVRRPTIFKTKRGGVSHDGGGVRGQTELGNFKEKGDSKFFRGIPRAVEGGKSLKGKGRGSTCKKVR